MSLNELNVNEWLGLDFELLIDARSPAEFNHSHIKNAQNFYALSDDEHKEIGTIYKQNKAHAKVLGAKYVCKNLDTHLEKIYDKHRVGSLVGIYCARGGMRSHSIASVLGMIGYRVVRLVGGYKAYRNHVLEAINRANEIKFITLFGNTGSFKTKLINSLDESVNLEKLANHLGSVFGSISGIQPSQKAFEDGIFESLLRLKNGVCFIEGESARIGNLTLPKPLYLAMRDGVSVEIRASLERRIECIMADYESISDEFFYSCMKKITPFIAKDARLQAIKAFENGDLAMVCEILLTKYYDNVYKKPARVDFSICADDFLQARAELLAIYDDLVRKKF